MTSTPTALLFPGQGVQRVGMGHELYVKSAAARDLFGLAERVCARPLRQLCFEGAEEELRRTEVAQLALLTVELAALAALAEAAGLGSAPTAALAALDARWVAGHSLGEYAASVAAGALAVEDAVRLVVERGRLMAAAPDGTMAVVLGLEVEALQRICDRTEGVVVVANDNAPGQVVLSGDRGAVARAAEAARAGGARRVLPLSVSGAFHSPLMAAAAPIFRAALDAVAIADPRVPIVGNVAAQPLLTGAEVREELAAQFAGPVRWRESLEWLAAAGAAAAVECGPGDVLAGMVRRTTPAVATRGLSTWADVQALAGEPTRP